MPKFYSRNGGVLLSQMPFNRRLDDEPIKDVMVVERYGDKTRFSIKVSARDEVHAERILMGVINSAFPGVVITPLSFDCIELSSWLYITEFQTTVLRSGCYYNVIASGRFIRLHAEFERWF